MIKQLARRKSSGLKTLKEKRILRWHKSSGASSSSGMPGDSKRTLNEITDGVDGEDALHLVFLYVKQLAYDRNLAAKVLKKFKKHGHTIESDIQNCYKRFLGQEDAGCLEESILSILPEKNRLQCYNHLYGRFLHHNELFQMLAKAVPEEELESFETRVIQSFTRENVTASRYLAVSPRGAVYVVRRGAVRISVKGNVVATLERGSVFEICVLSDRFVTIHNYTLDESMIPCSSSSGGHSNTLMTNSLFDIVDFHSKKRGKKASDNKSNGTSGSHGETTSATTLDILDDHHDDMSSFLDSDEDDDDDDDDEEEDDHGEEGDDGDGESLDAFSSSGKDKEAKETSIRGNSSSSSGARNRHRRSIHNAFGLISRRTGGITGERRGSLVQSGKEIRAYPWSAVNICAVEEDLSNVLIRSTAGSGVEGDNKSDDGQRSVTGGYTYGCELGVLSSDNLRAIVADHPNVARNLEVLTVSVEVQVEKEAEALRRKQEVIRKRLELEQRIATNRELEHACRAGSVQRATEAIAAGASVNEALDASGATSLHIAALFGHVEIASLLIRKEANVLNKDKEDRTPLHLCCLVTCWDERICQKITRILVQNEAALTQVDKWGNTPVHLAASTGDVTLLGILMNEIARLCPDASTILGMRNQDGYTPLDLCDSLESRRILKPKTHIVPDMR